MVDSNGECADDNNLACLNGGVNSGGGDFYLQQEEGNNNCKRRRLDDHHHLKSPAGYGQLKVDDDVEEEELDDRKPAAVKQPPINGKSNGRIFMEDISRKSMKRKLNDDNNINNIIDGNSSLPLAPSLDEYLKSGGSKFAPRPEWLSIKSSTATCSSSPSANLNHTLNLVATGRLPLELQLGVANDVNAAAAASNDANDDDNSLLAPRIEGVFQQPAVGGRLVDGGIGQDGQQPQQNQQPADEDPGDLQPQQNEEDEAVNPIPAQGGNFLMPVERLAQRRGRHQEPDSLQLLSARSVFAAAQQIDTQQQEREKTSEESPSNTNKSVFGVECDTALHLAIKQGATEAALDLIDKGAQVNIPNAKGISPLMLASQEGLLEVAKVLLRKGAIVNATTLRGSTALIQACHFGKLPLVKELLCNGALVNKANLKGTSALMRACQEGHEDVVKLLLSRGAGVNRRNDERMTALMLSSQRGHARIVEILIKEGADIDAKTAQESTSLMLACKRKHLNVAKILVASGAELYLKDSKNRTVLETAMRRGTAAASLLTDSAQVTFMQEASRKERNYTMVCLWKLLQNKRATVYLGMNNNSSTIHTVAENLNEGNTNVLMSLCESKRALVRAMTLPAPLVELVSSFIPLPLIWEKRLLLLTSRSHIDPDSAIFNTCDLIDEVLETGGIHAAFDAAGVDPPSTFQSWEVFASWCGRCDVILSRCGTDVDVSNIMAHESDPAHGPLRHVESSQTQRRRINCLQVIARAPQALKMILSSSPFGMPNSLFDKLKTWSDLQSLVRRLTDGGIHFDSSVSTELVVVARMAVMWCESSPGY